MRTRETEDNRDDEEIYGNKTEFSGVAPIKKEFLIEKSGAEQHGELENEYKDRKKRGQNKDRDKKMKIKRIPESDKLCKDTILGRECARGEECKYSHNVKGYLDNKPEDISTECPIFAAHGKCRFGVKCRFGSIHTTEDGSQRVDAKSFSEAKYLSSENDEKNPFDFELRKKIREKKYEYPRTEAAKSIIFNERNQKVSEGENCSDSSKIGVKRKEEEVLVWDVKKAKSDSVVDKLGALGEPEMKKKSVDFRGKTFLAPLTTVGNLPFRRICKDFGVDITCSEMALCNNLLAGNNPEWSIVKRHISEDIFGVQICGKDFDSIVRTTELLCNETDIDFIDLNVGCPIDSIYEKGCGSGMFRNVNKLYPIVRGMGLVSNVPISVKYRMGISHKNLIATDVTKKLAESSVMLGTVHGRTRLQRYSKLADWNYIKSCKDSTTTMPVFGNGDVFSWEDYWAHMENEKIDGVMIGRGALIKPWIFKEIAEKKVWDISSRERLDILKKFCDYGLDHWGSDDFGVQFTRRYLCEWQSFLHRYVPVGLLEVLPAKINQRPPLFKGRDELETLMASSNVNDWIKISEMFLGPAPPDFTFIPKHKSNAYEG